MKGTTLKEIRTGGGWKFFCPYDDVEPLAEFLEELDGRLSSAEYSAAWESLGSSINSSVWRFDVAGCGYIFKEFLSRGPFESIKAIFRGTRARRAWRAAVMLKEAGFLTPRLVVLGERCGVFCIEGNFIVTRFIEGSTGLATFIKGPLARMKPDAAMALRRNLARTLGGLVGRLHAKGIVHGDLRPDNILVVGSNKADPDFYLIDNERNEFFKEIPFELLVKNLVQVGMFFPQVVGATDRMRFYKAYLEFFPKARSVEKRLLRAVWTRTMERLSKAKYKNGSA